MPFDDLDSIAQATTYQIPYFFWKRFSTGGTTVKNGLFRQSGVPGAGSTPATGSGTAYSGATAGALALPTLTAGQTLYIAGVEAWTTTSGLLAVIDILVGNSGLSGTLTTSQTVNTVSLPRNTTGEGNEMCVVIHTAIGTTARTLTVTYTNSAGTTGRTTTVTLGGTGAREADTIVLVPLAAGDTGVRSIESVQLDASTGTAGDFGVLIFKRFTDLHVVNNIGDQKSGLEMGFPPVYAYGESTPCISFLWYTTANVTMDLHGSVAWAVA